MSLFRQSLMRLFTSLWVAQSQFYAYLIDRTETLFDDVVAMTACIKALTDRTSRAFAANGHLVDLCWRVESHPRAPLFRPPVAASVSEADDIGTEVAQGTKRRQVPCGRFFLRSSLRLLPRIVYQRGSFVLCPNVDVVQMARGLAALLTAAPWPVVLPRRPRPALVPQPARRVPLASWIVAPGATP